MRHILCLLLGCFILILNSQAQASGPTPTLPMPRKTPHFLPVPNAPAIDALAYMLIDANSGKVLAHKNAEKALAPASLTKMMTLYIVAEALSSGRISLDDQITVSQHAAHMGGSKMFLRVGEKVSVRDLIQGSVVVSGNDATIALAEYIAGSEDAFVNLMNQEAKRLSMKGTHFTDCTGMPDPKHYTNAADLAVLARTLIHDFPDFYHQWFAQKWFSHNKIKQNNRNRLLWRTNYVDGIKTGHTESAGYCLVSSGQQQGMRLISVIMGTPSDAIRSSASKALLAYGFRFYETHKLYSAGETISSPRAWMGRFQTVSLGAPHDIYITTANGRFRSLDAKITLNQTIRAPINKGQVLGQLMVSVDDKTLLTVPLQALSDNPKGSTFSRLKDYINLSWNHLWHKEPKV